MSEHILGLSWFNEDARHANNRDVTSENGVMISHRQWVFLLNAAQRAAKAMKEPNSANHQGCAYFLAGLAQGLSEKQEPFECHLEGAPEGNSLQHRLKSRSRPSEYSAPANKTSSSPHSVSKKPAPDSSSEGGLEFPPELVKCALDACQSFTAHLIDSLTLDLAPCADNSVAPGTAHFVGRAGFAPFIFNYQGTPTFSTRSFDLNIRTHSSSPLSASKDAPSDSSSEAGKKSVAPFDLSRESLATLYQLAENAQNLELLKAAALELNKRRGCDV